MQDMTIEEQLAISTLADATRQLHDAFRREQPSLTEVYTMINYVDRSMKQWKLVKNRGSKKS